MSETLKNRRETAAEQFEQTERYQAMSFLNQLGITKKLNEALLFHGRASDGQGKWRVDPTFNNAGNQTGNQNIDKIPALSTSDYETANKFALARAHSNPTKTEIYRILSDDPDATVLDASSWYKLDRNQKKAAQYVLSRTLLDITEGSPLDFENRDALNNLKPKDFVNQEGILPSEDIPKVSRKLGLDPSVVEQIGSAINTAHCLSAGRYDDLCYAFIDDEKTAIPIDENAINRNAAPTMPINKDYLANWFKENHIVGFKGRFISGTLQERIENSVLFDLDKINTEAELEQRKRERNRRLGQIALAANKNSLRNHSSLVETLSQNPYMKPEKIIKLAKQTPGYKEIFEADAGNWEKFTLEEHTETTLRLFDQNYADILPSSILPTMRMALLVHDLGKPVAVKRGEKANQKHYNDAYAEHFLRQNNVDEPTIKLIRTMIGEGMEWTTYLMVQRNWKDEAQLQRDNNRYYMFCRKAMQEYLGEERVDHETVFGFMNMLEVMQNCDSGAYTTMAITRGNKGYYRNYGSFDKVFGPTDFTKRRVRINKKRQ